MAIPAPRPEHPERRPLLTIAAVVSLLFVFLLGVKGLGEGFELLGQDLIQQFFAATGNPLVSFIIGLLATTLVQSSSVTTSMIVGLVAAPDNALPLANAVPMIMGANIGTTVTNTLVSLAHIGRRDEFERAFPVAICHDAFNYLTVLVLLPVELATGFLQRSAVWLSSAVGGLSGVEYESPLRSAIDAGLAPVIAFSELLFGTLPIAQAVLLIITSAMFIFFALFFLVKVMRSAVHSQVEALVNSMLGSSVLASIALGAVITMMVQSSSITTSLLVPLAGAGLLRLEQAFPVTIGANIGTTVTALLAALAVSGPNAVVGLEIALVHLLFNLAGLLLIYPVPQIRRIPLVAVRRLTELALVSRKKTVGAVALLFYGLPLVFIAISRLLS